MNIIKIALKTAKEISRQMLALERINSQRCVCKDIDTTKTIIENSK